MIDFVNHEEVLFVILNIVSTAKQVAAVDKIAVRSQYVKSAFIFNMTRYVQWPKNIQQKDNHINLCFLEKKVMQIQYISSLNKHSTCHILFLTQQQISILGENIAINMQALQHSNLILSSEILKLSKGN
ncbi:MAG: YfiR family protein [Pseudomonadota bacterium]